MTVTARARVHWQIYTPAGPGPGRGSGNPCVNSLWGLIGLTNFGGDDLTGRLNLPPLAGARLAVSGAPSESAAQTRMRRGSTPRTMRTR